MLRETASKLMKLSNGGSEEIRATGTSGITRMGRWAYQACLQTGKQTVVQVLYKLDASVYEDHSKQRR